MSSLEPYRKKPVIRRAPVTSPQPRKVILRERLAPPYFDTELVVTYRNQRHIDAPVKVRFKYSRMNDLLTYERGGMVKSLIEARAESVLASEVIVEPLLHRQDKAYTRVDVFNTLLMLVGGVTSWVAYNSGKDWVTFIMMMLVFSVAFYLKKPPPQMAILPPDFKNQYSMPLIEYPRYPDSFEVLPIASPADRDTYWKDALFQSGQTQDQFDADYDTINQFPHRLKVINESYDDMERRGVATGSREDFIKDAESDYKQALQRNAEVLKYFKTHPTN